MSSRFRIRLAALGAIALLAGCDRDARDARGKPLGESAPGPSPDTVFPGGAPIRPLDPRDPTVALGFANAMKDLPMKTTAGGILYVFTLPR